MNTAPLARRFLTLTLALTAAAAALLTGCSPSRTFVLQQPTPNTVHSGLALKQLDSPINVDPEAKKTFENKLAAKLKDKVGVAPSDHGDLIVQYRFTLFDQGLSAARVGSTITNIVGSPFYGLGDGAVGVEVIYSKPDGTPLGHIVTDGSIAGAFGTTSGALDEAAGSIATYTKANFQCPACGTLGVQLPERTQVNGLRSESY